MTTDTRTTNRNYPKPYPSNLLAADVVRLRDALDQIDADVTDRPTLTIVQGLIQAAIDGLVDGSSAALDTLNELSAALGDDANFASTVTTNLATKLNLAGGTMTGSLTLASNPNSSSMQAATAVYVENQVKDSHTTWVAVDDTASPYAAAANTRLLVDTTNGAVTVDLPASPQVGDYVEIIDAASSFDANNLTVGRNSLKIMGLDEDMTVGKLNASFTLVYASATSGWRIN